MKIGYAVLSFPGIGDDIGTLLVQVAHPREWRFDGKEIEMDEAGEGLCPLDPALTRRLSPIEWECSAG
jgi:hypothetical protein